MKTQLKKAALVGLATLLMVPAMFLAFPQTATAAQTNPQDQLERWLYYRGMRACLESGLTAQSLSREEVQDGQWDPRTEKEGFGYLAPDMDSNNDNDGTVACDDGSIWYRGSRLFGFTDAVGLLCALNREMEKLGDGGSIDPNGDDCEKSTKFEVKRDGNWQSALTNALQNEGSKDRPLFNINDNVGPDGSYTHEALLYLIGKRSLEIFCGNGVPLSEGISDLTNDENRVSVDVVNSDGTVDKSQIYFLKGDRDQDSLVDDVYYNQGGNSNEAKDLRCHEMAKMTRDYSAAYAAWAVKNPEESQQNEETPGGSSNNGNNNATCASESGALGWLFCPVLSAIDGTVDFLDRSVNNLLYVNKSTYDNRDINQAWAVMRNIALLLLVPMMIFMVIGTALNFGPFDPYTVKKALPRMFIATIFIVVSLPVTKFGVELSNNIGQGLGNLIIGAAPSDATSLQSVFASSGSGTSGEGLLFTGAVVGLVGAGLAGTLTIGILISFAIVTLVALLIGFVILVLRQVLIITLMVIAPLAILVWIFPGNDKLWGIWKTTFIAMLMMYPIIAILLASGRFVAGVVSF